MRVNKITLKNFRNHADRTFDFSSGINLLVGRNGSGKSSIFEALGIALFDIEPRDGNLKNAVSTDENTATIIVEFTANDEFDYVVERRIGSQSRYILKTIDGDIVSEGGEETKARIGELVGITNKNVKEIFKNVVSAYQNDLINIFNLTPAYRRNLFNKIFDTEIYENIFKSFLNIEKRYEGSINTNEEKISFFEEQLKEYEGLEDEK
ncbi:MAG: AAA family ATPase, partial [Kosmotogaceae bacterium]